MTPTTKTCKTCGAPFAASPNDYTVNCPKHRGRTPQTATATPAATTCFCGKTVTHANGHRVYIDGHPVTCPRGCGN
jgi:hypothetical protein